METGVRLGAACVMTAASAWGGRMLAAAQERRAAVLQEMLTDVRRLHVEMLERRTPIREALDACSGSICRETAKRMREGNTPFSAYRQASASLRMKGGALDCLAEGDMAALERLFVGLGKGSVGNQRALLIDAAEEIERLLHQARRRREEQGKLYASLGAMGGLALALLLL